MFDQSAELYDAIYDALGKDYRSEAERVLECITGLRGSMPLELLDVACGTGRHLEFFCEQVACTGLDIEPGLLEVAQTRCPNAEFVRADMTAFDLHRGFDAVTCLFSSIGYVCTVERLNNAILTMATHLNMGGVLVVEPWFGPEEWLPGVIQVVAAEVSGGKVVRMMRSDRVANRSILETHYLVGSSDSEIAHFTERHELGLFDQRQYVAAFEAAGLTPSIDPEGLTGRGLIVAVR
jgi:ubiquinone/menaquinone biosynthesis C-methylase UbiE